MVGGGWWIVDERRNESQYSLRRVVGGSGNGQLVISDEHHKTQGLAGVHMIHQMFMKQILQITLNVAYRVVQQGL